MESESPDPEDPEIAALLDFEPAVRKCERGDGWTPDRQRLFILGLAETGNPDRAAHRVGRTASGAWKVRTSADAEGFAAAWDAAVALYRCRNPGARTGRPPGWAGRGAEPAVRGARRRGPPPALDPAEAEQLLQEILGKYWRKLKRERECRLAGRIVEADFYVRQLTAIEIILDLGGKARLLLEALKRGEVPVLQIAATPASVLLDRLRRAWWREHGEADRPPPPALGAHDAALSTGIPTHYNAARDGDFEDWRRTQNEARALAAEAQAAWEEKARADAAAWAARTGGGDADGAEGAEARR